MKQFLKGQRVIWRIFIFGLTCLATAAHGQTVANYTDYAMTNNGVAENGKKLFQNQQRLACTKCHTVDGSGSLAGPDLSNVGEKFPRQELIRSVLQPSAEIAVGYVTTVVQTKDDEVYEGIIKRSEGDWMEMMGADGKLKRFENRDIKKKWSSTLSLMPEGLQTGLSVQDFTDIIAYLETLRQPLVVAAVRRGMPAVIPPAAKPAVFQPFFGSNVVFKAPLWFGQMPGQSNLFVVMEHGGNIWVAERTSSGDLKSNLVNLSGVVQFGPASGLLGMAFHPQFAENHRYFLKYQVLHDGKTSTEVVERKFSADYRHDDGQSRLLLNIPASTMDHNGGCIGFGPDGFLYIAMGDTGPQRDPEGNAQNMKLLTGKMLRIDVDKPDGNQPYGIPTDNPFIGQPDARPEIWALGFREPWRFSFDSETGDLWVGDVGQDTFEKVEIVRRGENYGWNVYEGFAPFSNKYRREDAKYISPVFCYHHSTGVSITGGFVYHGKNAPQLQGRYICADFQVQKVWALTQSNRELDSIVEIGRAPSRVSSIGQDAAGELYFVGYDSGLIYRADLSAVDLGSRQ